MKGRRTEEAHRNCVRSKVNRENAVFDVGAYFFAVSFRALLMEKHEEFFSISGVLTLVREGGRERERGEGERRGRSRLAISKSQLAI